MMFVKVNCAILFFVLILHLDGTNALQCYQCSSLNITGCGDPFDENSVQATECIDKEDRDKEFIGCRKLKQTIDGAIRVTRTCGYIKNKDAEKDSKCFKVSLTAASSSKYCACTQDGCNSAMQLMLNYFLPILTIVILLKM